MNHPNEIHDPTQPDDSHDRLMDIAISEVVGGNSPPDLSARIAAALRPMSSIARSYGTRSRREFWASLAVAVMLLVGVTMVLLPNVRSARERSHGEVAAASRATNLKDRSVQQHFGNASPQSLAAAAGNKTMPADGSAKNADFDSLSDLIQSTVKTETDTWHDSGGPVPSSQLSLDISQKQTLAGPEGAPPSTSTMDDAASLSGGTAARPTMLNAYSGTKPQSHESVRRSGPESGKPQWRLKDRSADPSGAPLLAKSQLSDEIATLDGAKEIKAGLEFRGRGITAHGIDPNISGHKYARGAAPRPTTSQVDEIRDLQQHGKPTQKLLTELSRRLDKSVDLGAQTDEGTGPDLSGDQYTRIVENPFIKTEGGAAVSTFSIDVDTASYSNVRQFLMAMNQLPPPDAVRIEELINYFHYEYAGPPPAPGSAGGSPDAAPFAAHVEVTSCPWAPDHRLARIGIKGRELDRNKRPQSNLVFLVDVSGSMDEPAKLPLVIYGLEQLARELGENDRVAIVVYASSEGLVLPSTRGDKQDTILAALSKLKAGGSTAGGAGIQLAYQLAEDNFIKGGTNRVILCTDGDFNVGVTSTAELQRLVEKKAKDTGVFLSVLGFGRGNLNDTMMEAISNHGNGNYHYVDNRTEARRVLVEEMTGTLVTIAKDVKIQIEFNPAQVSGYRLIGYEDRMLRTEDFNDDKKDAGEIGAGHTVTALYEIVPAGKNVEVGGVDALKYQKPATEDAGSNDKASESSKISKELLTLKMRYKAPDGETSKKLEWPITDDGKAFAAASGDLKFAASVAGFGLMLRDSQYKGNLTYAAVLELAQGGIGEDPHGYRKEFLDMVRKAKELRHE